MMVRAGRDRAAEREYCLNLFFCPKNAQNERRTDREGPWSTHPRAPLVSSWCFSSLLLFRLSKDTSQKIRISSLSSPKIMTRVHSRMFIVLCAVLLLLLPLHATAPDAVNEKSNEAEGTGGGAEPSMVTLTEVEVKKLRVKAIRGLLEDRGYDCKGCMEKEEFVARLLEVIRWML